MKRKAKGLPRQEVFIRSGNGSTIEPGKPVKRVAAKKTPAKKPAVKPPATAAAAPSEPAS